MDDNKRPEEEGVEENKLERELEEQKLEKGKVATFAENLTPAIETFYTVGKLVIIVFIFVFASMHISDVTAYLRLWLNNATHISLFGIGADRQLSADLKIANLASLGKTPDSMGINQDIARGAVVRAIRNAPAIFGARILWVDEKPDSNKLQIGILEDLGMQVFRLKNTQETLTFLSVFVPDLIISNVAREGDQQEPLKKCPAHYFEVPANIETDLDTLNAETMAGTGKATGFAMAEAISRVKPELTDHLNPRIIYFSARSGGLVANQCARLVTNRTDIMLQTVVSAIEELKWETLKSVEKQPEKP